MMRSTGAKGGGRGGGGGGGGILADSVIKVIYASKLKKNIK